MARVDDALKRLRTGGYGICESCGQPIDPRRLRDFQMPICVISCPAGKDRFIRPPEEEVLDMHEIDARETSLRSPVMTCLMSMGWIETVYKAKYTEEGG